MAEHKPEKGMMRTQEIITIKRELDRAVQERMKLSHIYYHHNYDDSIVVSAASA